MVFQYCFWCTQVSNRFNSAAIEKLLYNHLFQDNPDFAEVICTVLDNIPSEPYYRPVDAAS